MKEYTFLFKPFFFIFNLIFATWLVLSIERLKPSDFGNKKSIFERPATLRKVSEADKPKLRQLAYDFKSGKIDEATLEKEIDAFVAPK
jgi:hypothetical protein